jgi:uncharacterized protein (TIGR00255 family)
MKSMTGYAFKELHEKAWTLSIEIKSYNSRFLEIFVNVPPLLSGLEPKIRVIAAESIRRGKVEITVRLKENAAPEIRVNTKIAEAYCKAFSELSVRLHLYEEPTLSLILGMEGVIGAEQNRDDGVYWEKLEILLHSALIQLANERIREGELTQTTVVSLLKSLETSLEIIENCAKDEEILLKEKLRARFAEIADNYANDPIMQSRILSETAVLLMKYTIAEEIARLKAHFTDFTTEISDNPAPGKKLDFLCQEINREVNTIGSKACHMEVSRAVVSMKDALENIREQLRNVE